MIIFMQKKLKIKQMKIIVILSLITVGILFFLQIGVGTKRTNIYTTNCGKQHLQIDKVEIRQYSNANINYEFLWNEKSLGKVSRSSTIMPESPDVAFGKTNYILFNPVVRNYSVHQVILFVDDRLISKDDFLQLAHCIEKNYNEIYKAISDDAGLSQFALEAVIYGNYEKFVGTYTNGMQQMKRILIHIQPDGTIGVQKGSDKKYIIISGSAFGMSDKADKLTQTIYIDSSKLSIDALREFRNTKTDRPLELDYHLMYK